MSLFFCYHDDSCWLSVSSGSRRFLRFWMSSCSKMIDLEATIYTEPVEIGSWTGRRKLLTSWFALVPWYRRPVFSRIGMGQWPTHTSHQNVKKKDMFVRFDLSMQLWWILTMCVTRSFRIALRYYCQIRVLVFDLSTMRLPGIDPNAYRDLFFFGHPNNQRICSFLWRAHDLLRGKDVLNLNYKGRDCHWAGRHGTFLFGCFLGNETILLIR